MMPKPQANSSPIHIAVQRWLEQSSQSALDDQTPRDELLSSAPKRYTIYEPVALLPSGSFASLPWTSALGSSNADDRERSLWSLILEELSRKAKGSLTHLAINEGIPLHKGNQEENVLRSPSGLRMLYGDFGPAVLAGDEPSQDDFAQTLWVSTKQNGIFQTWAPKWTMFSRGNIKEKARLLNMGAARKGSYAVDLYAGIGYFVFSYASLGMRVLCWEINEWSVEGLRRGARGNKWTVKVVQGDDLQIPTDDILASGEQIIVFLESNEKAGARIRAAQEKGLARDIQHVNCGFLPTSEPSWKSAWDITRYAPEARLHLHENVGVNDIERRKQDIGHLFEKWAGDEARTPVAEHVELVKTFAPGVYHCVFDVHITRSNIT